MKLTTALINTTLLFSIHAFAQTAPTAPARPAFAPLPADELPLDVVVEWAQAALAACKANGYNVTAIYMNNNYDTKLFMRADGAPAITGDIGRRKAYTVIKMGMSSAEFAASVAVKPGSPPPVTAPGMPFGAPPLPYADANLIVFGGGLQIKVKDKVVGAVSISGAPGSDKDIVCVEAGLAKIADKLK